MTLPTSIPRPLAEAARAEARKVFTGETTATGLITALIGYGVLTAAQGDAVVGLLGLIPGAVALVGAIVSKAQGALATFREAEPKVTPIDAPAVTIGGTRTPLVVSASSERLDPVTDSPMSPDPAVVRDDVPLRDEPGFY